MKSSATKTVPQSVCTDMMIDHWAIMDPKGRFLTHQNRCHPDLEKAYLYDRKMDATRSINNFRTSPGKFPHIPAGLRLVKIKVRTQKAMWYEP